MGPRFKDHVSQGLVMRRANEKIGQLVVRMRVKLPAGPANPMVDSDLAGVAVKRGLQRTVADNDESQSSAADRFAEQGERSQQVGESLGRVKATDCQQNDRVFRDVQLPP
ncbi:MAG: hypothetical protein AW07_03068 [Candidatus Accumulibacter sp. SK-11]|nr:MAG: hypothetical protein AW07_03068 [Candidatus Accumulibacter sp. SK-11]